MKAEEKSKSLLYKILSNLKNKPSRKLSDRQRKEFKIQKRRDTQKNIFKEEFKTKKFPYWGKPHFIGERELFFFHNLSDLIGNSYYIIPQVHLSHILNTIPKSPEQKFNNYFNQINWRSVDFVLFNKPDFTFKLAIELDDSTHDLLDRLKRDAFVEYVFKKTDLKLIRMNSFDVEKILFYL